MAPVLIRCQFRVLFPRRAQTYGLFCCPLPIRTLCDSLGRTHSFWIVEPPLSGFIGDRQPILADHRDHNVAPRDLDEVVTVREPPAHKAWRTVGQLNLLVVGGYEMGFDLMPEGSGSRLTVWIDYKLPARGFGRWLPFLGRMYARWCIEQMTTDARDAFAPKPA